MVVLLSSHSLLKKKKGIKDSPPSLLAKEPHLSLPSCGVSLFIDGVLFVTAVRDVRTSPLPQIQLWLHTHLRRSRGRVLTLFPPLESAIKWEENHYISLSSYHFSLSSVGGWRSEMGQSRWPWLALMASFSSVTFLRQLFLFQLFLVPPFLMPLLLMMVWPVKLSKETHSNHVKFWLF